MSSVRTTRPLNPQIRDEAAAWLLAFCEEEVDARACEEFNAWLRTSPEHVRAYLRIAAFWQDASLFEKYRQYGLEEIVQRALQESNVVLLDQQPKATQLAVQEPPRRKWRSYGVAASVAVVCVAAAALTWLQLSRPLTYSTGAGEQRVITLADGSTVEMNSRSKIAVRYQESVREVDLIAGQALFRVAKQPTRPFIVHSDGANVRAVGTEFDVYRKSKATVVTVVEGRVAVSGAGSSASGSRGNIPQALDSGASGSAANSVLVSAGERIVVTGRALTSPETIDPVVATAWLNGQLVFESVPLSEVVEEFNRYAVQRLIVDDPRLQDIRISGVYASNDAQQFAEFLRQRFDIRVRQTDAEIRIERK